MVENVEDGPGETKPNFVEKSGDVKPPKVEGNPNIDGASIHVEAFKYVDSGVLPLHANEVDTARFFFDNIKWKDRDDLLNWARRQANKAGFTIVTQRSSLINDVIYLRISKVSIYVSSPQGLVRYLGLFDVNYHFKFDR